MSLHTTPDSYTKLLIHSNTANDSAVFVDSGVTGHTVNKSGDPVHSTAQAKFGTTSMHFDGTGDYLIVGNHADWNFGTGDFTIDFWAKAAVANSNSVWIGRANTSTGHSTWFFRIESATVVTWANAPVENQNQYTYTVGTSEWKHYAAVRSSGTTTVYVNGTAIGSQTDGNNYDSNGGDVYIGARQYNSSLTQHHSGYIDELRVSKGIARWTDSFVPPNKPYSVVDDDFVTDAAGIEDDGSGNTTFGRDIIVKSNPDEASTDIVFSVQDKVGIERLGVKANGVLYNESSIASTTPRVIMGDGWLSGDYPAASRGTYFQGYQTVTSGNPIIVGKSEYSTGTLDGAITGILSVTYTQDGDANRSGYYLFRIGYTGDTTTTTVQSAVQSSSCTCTKTNSGGVMSLNVTPTTFASATVKVFYTFQGIISQDL